jgi:hypothetical protein
MEEVVRRCAPPLPTTAHLISVRSHSSSTQTCASLLCGVRCRIINPETRKKGPIVGIVKAYIAQKKAQREQRHSM